MTPPLLFTRGAIREALVRLACAALLIALGCALGWALGRWL